MNYSTFCEGNLSETYRRYRRTPQSLLLGVTRETAEQVHGLAVQWMNEFCSRDPEQFHAVARDPNTGAFPVWVLGPLIDFILNRLGVTGLKRILLKAFIQILIYVAIAALFAAPRASRFGQADPAGVAELLQSLARESGRA